MQLQKKNISLIEVALSIALISMIAVFMLRLFHQGQLYDRSNRMYTIACFLAQEKMEELSTDSYAALFTANNPPESGPPYSLVIPPDELKAPVAGFADFQRSVDVTCPFYADRETFLDVEFTDVAHIEVVVYWDGQKQEKSVTFNTLITNF
ncbi:MAG: hypothetical protein GY858_01970 [Candidatus Omnitrophica bacterium]|nr:hypothetical protein [Candidatus Omnitrophota bacterium]